MRGQDDRVWSGDAGPSRDDAFHKSANPRVYVAREASEAALAQLRTHVESFAEHPALVAGPGLGKTLLLHVLAERLAERWLSVHLPYPLMPCDELCRWALQALGEEPTTDPEAALLSAADTTEVPGGILLLIDDADAMPHPTARRIMALSRASEGRLRLVFAGTERFHSGSGNWLADVSDEVVVVDFNCPLNVDEGIQYLGSKLEGLDRRRRAIFSPDVLHAIWQESEGVPAAIDSAASDLLLRAVTRPQTLSAPSPPPSIPDESPRRARLVGLGATEERFQRLAAEAEPVETPAFPSETRPPSSPTLSRRPPAPVPRRRPRAPQKPSRAKIGGPGRIVLGSAAGVLIAIGLTGLLDPDFFHRLQEGEPGRPDPVEIAALTHRDSGFDLLDARANGTRGLDPQTPDVAAGAPASPDGDIDPESEQLPSVSAGPEAEGSQPSREAGSGDSESEWLPDLSGKSDDDELPELLPKVSARPPVVREYEDTPEAAASESEASADVREALAETADLEPPTVAAVRVVAPEGTYVEVEGQTYGPAPFSEALQIPEGRRKVTARLPDGVVVRRTVEASDGIRIVFY